MAPYPRGSQAMVTAPLTSTLDKRWPIPRYTYYVVSHQSQFLLLSGVIGSRRGGGGGGRGLQAHWSDMYKPYIESPLLQRSILLSFNSISSQNHVTTPVSLQIVKLLGISYFRIWKCTLGMSTQRVWPMLRGYYSHCQCHWDNLVDATAS